MTATHKKKLNPVVRLISVIAEYVVPKRSEPETERRYVPSNCIVTLGYDACQRSLQVEYFNGLLYRISDVSPQDHENLNSADDFDQAYQQLIAKGHKMTKVGMALPVYR